MSNDVETNDCPLPDCSRTFGAQEEFTVHINTKHAGEYQRDDWPDTPAGRQARRSREKSDEE